MRKFLTCLTAAALLATPAYAEARGFKSDIGTTITGPLKLEIGVSDDLAHRANHLPKRLSHRGSGARLNAAFANNGRYGDKAIEYLIEDIQDELVQDFSKRNISLSDDAPTLLKVTIEMAKPNRPTFEQLSHDVSLSYQSFGIGGAEVSVEIVSAGGDVLGTASYDYYPSLNERPGMTAATWSDANRAFSRFSNRLSKKLAAAGAGTT
ncbi:hypothetical protein GCM10011309_10680 [Litorimonas cladophorae]|uniref:DUF3313 domain-containing protein n=1 Tax=Litorimonas cladophorae TaxID=1220491 RepID=A0A918KH04_9PROT|nr:hypothetical protein [Litorimonas cladophorae]GGX62573.1 hypothetical protein GCM10011309_10680 [Litorimonas cladophorae]